MNNGNKTNNIDRQEENVTMQDLMYLYTTKWYWFVISIVLALAIAGTVILKTPPVYNRYAEILIKPNNEEGTIASDMAGLDQLGIIKTRSNVKDELFILQSPALMGEVVDRLKLDITYKRDDILYNKTTYGEELPIEVKFLDLQSKETGKFTLEIKGDKATLHSFKSKKHIPYQGNDITINLGETAETPLGKITVEKNRYYKSNIEATYFIEKKSHYETTEKSTKKLKAYLKDDKGSNVIYLSYNDVSAERAEQLLQTLIDIYNEKWVADKNQTSEKTSDFINDRLVVIEEELGLVDSDISAYKSENLLPDIQKMSDIYMDQSSTNNIELETLRTQLRVAKSVKKQLTQEITKLELLPVNSGIDNHSVETQITEYNKQLLQRNSLVANSSENNPIVKDLDENLFLMKRSIIVSIENQINTLKTKISSLKETESKMTDKLAAGPSQAKYLISVERKQKVKESLYIYLLQKREENELSQAFTTYNNRIVTPPGGSPEPVTPNILYIILIAIGAGLIIPGASLYIKETTNTKVRGKKDIEHLSIPMAGEIPNIENKEKPTNNDKEKIELIVKNGNHNVINEAFRVLRTNVEFMTDKGRNGNVIAFSSFNPGSGKSFIAMNLANSLAIAGKKVLLIDGDLRHATVSYSQDSPKTGLSNYLGHFTDNIEESITKDKNDNLFDILPVGIIPPNPSELLNEPRLQEVIESQRKRYDYVIIDCPPINIVADTAIIEKLADRTMFVIRVGVLEREMLKELQNIHDEKQIKNMAIILNGTKMTKGKYGYRYGYRYGYNN